MKKTIYPSGWHEERLRRVLKHYETQSDDEAVAEDEVFLERIPEGAPSPSAPLRRQRSELPVAQKATGQPIPALSNADLYRILDEEDAAD